MLERVLETEAMDTPTEAESYNSMDHAEVNRVFVRDFLESGGDVDFTVDVGTGTALIPIELCRSRFSGKVVGVDIARHMLRVGRRNVVTHSMSERIVLVQCDARRLPFRDGSVPAVCSNSIVHHIPEPSEVLRESWRITAPGGLFFFRDLARPNDEEELTSLVQTYTGNESAFQQKMFADSLRAALRVEEVRELAEAMGIDPQTVTMTSDRHWTWSVRKPA
ncbi:class I SAM-dependent methyltransferase [Thermostilla marina]